jgi:hypothetical protein
LDRSQACRYHGSELTARCAIQKQRSRDFSHPWGPPIMSAGPRRAFLFERRFEALTGGSKPRPDRDFRDRPEFAKRAALTVSVTRSSRDASRRRAFENRNRHQEPRLVRRSSFARRHSAFRARRARHVSSLGGARARATTAMADARATMERLARLAKAQVRFDPARRPRESGHPPFIRRGSRQLCSYPRPDALPPLLVCRWTRSSPASGTPPSA